MKARNTIMAAGRKRERKTPTKTELPEELIREEILIRLPIKSVVRFKSVCKSWLSLFSDPQFVKEHHTRSATQNPNGYDCLIAEKDNRIVIISRYKETLVLRKDNSYQLVGSIHGLVCLLRCQNLSLWNPAIHQFKEFTLPPHYAGDHINIIGLSFDPFSNDYKVAVLSDLGFGSVYSFKSDYWTDIIVPVQLLHKIQFNDSFTPATIVNGCPYWTRTRYTNARHFASLASVKFDAGSNEYQFLPEFHYDKGNARGKFFTFVNMKDCLTLMVYKPDSQNTLMEIYSLDEKVCGVWCKMYSFGPLDFIKRGFLPHDFIKWGSLSQGFEYGGEIVFHVGGNFFCYDHKTDTISRIQKSTPKRIVRCYRYTPSLVFLPGMKSVYLETQTRAYGLCSRPPRRLINSLKD